MRARSVLQSVICTIAIAGCTMRLGHVGRYRETFLRYEEAWATPTTLLLGYTLATEDDGPTDVGWAAVSLADLSGGEPAASIAVHGRAGTLASDVRAHATAVPIRHARYRRDDAPDPGSCLAVYVGTGIANPAEATVVSWCEAPETRSMRLSPFLDRERRALWAYPVLVAAYPGAALVDAALAPMALVWMYYNPPCCDAHAAR